MPPSSLSASAFLSTGVVASALAGCMGVTVRSNFESDFRCPAASEVTDLGGDRYRVTGCGREAVYQCEREERGPICSLQLTADLEPEGESGLPATEPVISRAKVVKNDDGDPTVSLDIRLDAYSLVTLRAEPSSAPDVVQFRLLHRPEKELERCDFGFMLNGQLMETPNLNVSKQRSALIFSMRLSGEVVRDLGTSRKLSFKACDQRWLLEPEQIVELHRFVNLYEDELAWKNGGSEVDPAGTESDAPIRPAQEPKSSAEP